MTTMSAVRQPRRRTAHHSARGAEAERRARQMHVRYEEGASLEEVGQEFGLSRERVRQLFARFELSVRSLRDAAALQRAKHRARADEVVVAFLELRDEATVAERPDMPQTAVHEIVRERVPAGERRKRKQVPKRYSEQELIDCLLQASAELGGVLTTSAYSELARRRTMSDGRVWPGHQTHFHRFGSWRKALAAAGLRANRASAIAGQRLFEAGHCVDALRHLDRELGRIPTAAEYERFASASGGAYPSLATVRNRLGSWNEALGRAGL